MSEQKGQQSQSEAGNARAEWTSVQAYLLAAVCLLLGVALGYLFHGSASPTAQASAPAATQQDATVQTQQLAQSEAALAQAVAPFVEAVQKNPNDFDALVQLGNMDYDARQYPSAIEY